MYCSVLASLKRLFANKSTRSCQNYSKNRLKWWTENFYNKPRKNLSAFHCELEARNIKSRRKNLTNSQNIIAECSFKKSDRRKLIASNKKFVFFFEKRYQIEKKRTQKFWSTWVPKSVVKTERTWQSLTTTPKARKVPASWVRSEVYPTWVHCGQ